MYAIFSLMARKWRGKEGSSSGQSAFKTKKGVGDYTIMNELKKCGGTVVIAN
jgi:hypothetical protein